MNGLFSRFVSDTSGGVPFRKASNGRGASSGIASFDEVFRPETVSAGLVAGWVTVGKYIKFPAYWHGETEKRTLFSCLGFLSSLLFVKLFKIYRPVHSLAIRTVRVGLERETACFPAGIPLSGPSAHGEIIIDYFYLFGRLYESYD